MKIKSDPKSHLVFFGTVFSPVVLEMERQHLSMGVGLGQLGTNSYIDQKIFQIARKVQAPRATAAPEAGRRPSRYGAAME